MTAYLLGNGTGDLINTARHELSVVPVTLKAAQDFVTAHHRHSKRPQGHKFSIGLELAGSLVGVACSGRPVARLLDDGRTIEVIRVTTLGHRNAPSMLYGASRRAAAAMGYTRGFTYTLESEPGSSLLASGWTLDAELPARPGWKASSSGRLKTLRDDSSGGVARRRWTWTTR